MRKTRQNLGKVNQTTKNKVSRSYEILEGTTYKGNGTQVGNSVLKSNLFTEQPNLEDEISLRGEGLSQPDFWPFLFLLFFRGFCLNFLFFRGFVVWKLKKMTSSLLPEWLLIPKSFPRHCHFHPSPYPNILFIGNIPFSIKGITLFSLGCEAIYIYITPKIPK